MSINPISFPVIPFIPFNPLLNLNMPITYTNEGIRFSYDNQGNIFYYSPNGYPYYLDEMNQPFYLNKFEERIYFDFDYRGDVRVREKILDYGIYPEDHSIPKPLIIQKKIHVRKKNPGHGTYLEDHSIPKQLNLQKNKSKKITLSNEKLCSLFNIKNEDKNIRLPYLSDHSIIWYKIKKQNDDNSFVLASWNLLRKAKKYPSNKFKSEYNNPWNNTESKIEYKNRVQAQVEKILNIIKAIDSLSIFLLQGALFFYEDTKFYNQFLLKLKENNWNMMKSSSYDLDLLTLYNNNKLTSKIKAKNLFTAQNKKHTCLQSIFIEHETNAIITIGNVHFPPTLALKGFKRFFHSINKEKQGLNNDILAIYGGTINKKNNKMIANRLYPSTIQKNGKHSRKDGLIYVKSNDKILKVKEMPSSYFNNKEMSLSRSTVNFVDLFGKKIPEKIDLDLNNELKDYICKLSVKLDSKFMPCGKLFLNYDEKFRNYKIKIFDKEKAITFIDRISPFLERIPSIVHQATLKKVSYLEIDLTIKEMHDVFKNLFNENDYSLLVDQSLNFNSCLNKDFFAPFISFSKREKKSKKQSILIENEIKSYATRKKELKNS